MHADSCAAIPTHAVVHRRYTKARAVHPVPAIFGHNIVENHLNDYFAGQAYGYYETQYEMTHPNLNLGDADLGASPSPALSRRFRQSLSLARAHSFSRSDTAESCVIL